MWVDMGVDIKVGDMCIDMRVYMRVTWGWVTCGLTWGFT